MILATIVSGFAGFLSSAIPSVLQMVQDKSDKRHELQILQFQVENAKILAEAKVTEVHALAEATESEALYRTYTSNSPLMEAYNASVRPTIAYAFFLLYASLKYIYWAQGATGILWTEDDMVIFSAIISFYYGSRCFNKKQLKE